LIAIIVATGQDEAFEGLNEYLPVPLLPIGDRPFLQHIVEYLAHQQVRRFEFVLSHLPEKIEAALGDGVRWGCEFRYHLLPLGADPLRLVRTLSAGRQDTVVLCTAVCLPALDLAAIKPSTLIQYRDGEGVPKWTGWGVFTAQDLSLPDFDALPVMDAERCLCIRTGQEFLVSQRQALEQFFPGLMLSGRQADPGIWISRNVALHPTAKLTAPLYIGENCRIGRGAQIGPSAVIGQNCIIDAHTIVVDSTVAAGTYVGEGLELNSVIVDRNRLLNIRLGTSLLASEAFLLGSLTSRSSGRVPQRIASILIALSLLVFLWPVLLLTGLCLTLAKKGSLVFSEIVRIPTEDDPAGWRESRVFRFQVAGGHGRGGCFLFQFLPGLISVLSGDLFLVGVQPRSRTQLLQLPADWRSLYMKTKAGLITEAAVMFGENASADETYSAEAFYSATESVSHDCKLVGLWLWSFISGPKKTGIDLAEDANS
jgi:lipopolysaccharide/colanic/teichoic acid biosynthesis glycosyltransferase